jgi:hypothetical protein
MMRVYSHPWVERFYRRYSRAAYITSREVLDFLRARQLAGFSHAREEISQVPPRGFSERA